MTKVEERAYNDLLHVLRLPDGSPLWRPYMPYLSSMPIYYTTQQEALSVAEYAWYIKSARYIRDCPGRRLAKKLQQSAAVQLYKLHQGEVLKATGER